MTPLELIVLFLQASVIVNVFALGLEATTEDALYVLRRPAQLARSVLAMFVVMPLCAMTIARFTQLPTALEVALVALSISPVPPLLPKKQDKAGGHSSYALGLVVCMGLLSLVVLPVAAHVLALVFGRTFTMPMLAIALLLAKMIAGPLAAGMLLGALWPRARRIARPAILLAGWLLPLGGAVVLYGGRHAIEGALNATTLLALLGFIVIGLAVGHALGGPAREHRIVLGMSTATRHPGVAIALATATFPQEHGIAVLVLLYVLLGMLVSLVYMNWQQGKDDAPALPRAI